jgi:hypothetical protein
VPAANPGPVTCWGCEGIRSLFEKYVLPRHNCAVIVSLRGTNTMSLTQRRPTSEVPYLRRNSLAAVNLCQGLSNYNAVTSRPVHHKHMHRAPAGAYIAQTAFKDGAIGGWVPLRLRRA